MRVWLVKCVGKVWGAVEEWVKWECRVYVGAIEVCG